MNGLSKVIWLAATVVGGGLSVSACATEDYVDQHVAAVSMRLDQVQTEVTAVNTRVDGVERTAQTAQQTANAAGALANTKADAKFVYNDLGGSSAVTFATNKWTLSDEAQATLTAMAEKLKTDNKSVYLEIVGHGDPRGSVIQNRELGAKRALNVQRFLSEQGVPLSHMNVVSWGEERVADPKSRTPEDLQQSRRVDVNVKG